MPDPYNTKAAAALWIDANRETLPLNIDSWKINVAVRIEQKEVTICRGKYLAKVYHTDPFYKPMSRVIRVKI